MMVSYKKIIQIRQHGDLHGSTPLLGGGFFPSDDFFGQNRSEVLTETDMKGIPTGYFRFHAAMKNEWKLPMYPCIDEKYGDLKRDIYLSNIFKYGDFPHMSSNAWPSMIANWGKHAAWHCDLFPRSAAKYPQVDQRITRCQEEKSTDKKFIDGHGSNKKLGTKCPKKSWVGLFVV